MKEIRLQVTQEQRDAIERAASVAGLTIAGFVRHAALRAAAEAVEKG